MPLGTNEEFTEVVLKAAVEVLARMNILRLPDG